MSGHHRPRSGREEWGGKALHPFPRDGDAAGGATGGEHHQVGIEAEVGKIGG